MASPRSVDSSVPEVTGNVSLSEHIKNVITSLTSTVKIARILGENLGSGTLKQGKKLKFDDGTAIGIEDLASYVSSIKNELRKIPKMVNDERKAEKAAKRRRRLENSEDRVSKSHQPNQFTMPLIEFFRSVNLGQDPTGRGRLQDYADMATFFTNGIGSLPFGVSLFNVFGNCYKQQTGNTKVYLDDAAQSKLRGALDHLKKKKEEALAQALADPETSEKEREGRRIDLDRLKSGEIQIKDYTRILSYYLVKEAPKDAAGNPIDMSGWAPHVENMVNITKQLNASNKKKAEAAAQAPAAPRGVVAPPVPVVTRAVAPVPVVPTVSARGASPVAPTRRR